MRAAAGVCSLVGLQLPPEPCARSVQTHGAGRPGAVHDPRHLRRVEFLPVAQEQDFTVGVGQAPQGARETAVGQLGRWARLDGRMPQPLEKSAAARDPAALIGQDPPRHSIKPRQHVLRQRRPPAPCDQEHLRSDLVGGLPIGATHRVAMHSRSVKLVELRNRVELITVHTPQYGRQALPITVSGE